MINFLKNKFSLIFIYVLSMNVNEIHARNFDLTINNSAYRSFYSARFSLTSSNLPDGFFSTRAGRSFPVFTNRIITTGFSTSASKNTDTSPINGMCIFYAGAAAGGKQNTCYFLKSRIILLDKINLDGAFFYMLNGDKLYNANFSLGKSISFSTGIEWGDRTFFVNRDSTLELVKFKNLSTGQYAYYSSLTGVSFPQQVTTFAFGISFNPKKASINYWRGKGRCWSLYNIKFEGLFAPAVSYSKVFSVMEGTYEETYTPYLIENATIKHMGFRLVIDTRLSSKLGIMMEAGTRPGIKSEINSEGRFSNGYLRMGVEIGISVGGRKSLRNADIDTEER